MRRSMGKKKSAGRKGPKAIEWVGGIIAVPPGTVDESTPEVPEVLVWIRDMRGPTSRGMRSRTTGASYRSRSKLSACETPSSRSSVS